MKFGLLICVLCSWVLVVRGRVLWWEEEPQADEPQTDEDDEGTDVLRMVEALSSDLQEVMGQDDAWLTRYQQVAKMMEGNNELAEELLEISRTAVPIIWNTFMGKLMMSTLKQIEKGGVGVPPHYATKGSLLPPPPKFLVVYPSELTVDDHFIAQATVRTTAEANLGFCLYFAPEEGEQLDFDHGDIFFAMHIRWHFDYGNSREIVFNDRYDGVWSRPEMAVGGDKWPDFNVGEKFIISVSKSGPCFQTIIILGRDMHMNRPTSLPHITFCPKNPRTGDLRKLLLTVNEDKVDAGEVIIHYITWFPTD